MCVMDFVSNRGVILTLIGRSVIQRNWCLSVCILSFDDLKYPLLKKRFSDYVLTEQITSSSSVVQLKLKCLQKPTHDDIIEAKEFYIQLSFERYKAKLALFF